MNELNHFGSIWRLKMVAKAAILNLQSSDYSVMFILVRLDSLVPKTWV